MKPFVAKKIGLFDPQNAQLCLVHLAMAFTGLPWITHDYSHLLGRHSGASIHDLYMPPPIDSGLGTALPKAGV